MFAFTTNRHHKKEVCIFPHSCIYASPSKIHRTVVLLLVGLLFYANHCTCQKNSFLQFVSPIGGPFVLNLLHNVKLCQMVHGYITRIITVCDEGFGCSGILRDKDREHRQMYVS